MRTFPVSDITILHLIRFTFLLKFTSLQSTVHKKVSSIPLVGERRGRNEEAYSFDSGFVSVLLEIIKVHDITTNEVLLEISVNHSRRLRCLCTFSDCPGSYFLRTTSEVSNELTKTGSKSVSPSSTRDRETEHESKRDVR